MAKEKAGWKWVFFLEETERRERRERRNGATLGGLEVPRSLAVKDMLKKAKELPKEHQPSYILLAVAEMAAIGFGLPKDSFTNLLKNR
ncbi:hypothetical protein OSB04_013029 [Centaurea solstitialis]|uniref:Uncharacterized protein n=1 Tax=Centaurea solstitialis TaxID=347529 RepID=A0AA38TP67_9ASTR|nr:hypothetical protein OSB04_013029 [Centaurea solstitialis]